MLAAKVRKHPERKTSCMKEGNAVTSRMETAAGRHGGHRADAENGDRHSGGTTGTSAEAAAAPSEDVLANRTTVRGESRTCLARHRSRCSAGALFTEDMLDEAVEAMLAIGLRNIRRIQASDGSRSFSSAPYASARESWRNGWHRPHAKSAVSPIVRRQNSADVSSRPVEDS
jgi:hypothetical protein